MAALTPYTSTEAVLAACGLTDNEISHEDILEQQIELSLEVDLQQWLPNHAEIWAAHLAAGATAEEILLGKLLRLFSLWFCTYMVLGTELAVPSRIFDGKTDMRRLLELDLTALRKRASGFASSYKARLLQIANPGTSAITTFPVIGLSKPAKDPVTGEGI